jgi:hypothetical protein
MYQLSDQACTYLSLAELRIAISYHYKVHCTLEKIIEILQELCADDIFYELECKEHPLKQRGPNPVSFTVENIKNPSTIFEIAVNSPIVDDVRHLTGTCRRHNNNISARTVLISQPTALVVTTITTAWRLTPASLLEVSSDISTGKSFFDVTNSIESEPKCPISLLPPKRYLVSF